MDNAMALAHKVTVKSYMTPAERDKIYHTANRLGISSSEYIRRVVTGLRLPQPGNAQSVRDLLKINADLARLGNLFRLALDEGTDLELEGLASKIAETQALLKSKIREL